MRPRQLALFGAQSVHVGLGGKCVMCRVLLSLAAVWDDCNGCPGMVIPVPWWMELAADEAPVLEQLEAA